MIQKCCQNCIARLSRQTHHVIDACPLSNLLWNCINLHTVLSPSWLKLDYGGQLDCCLDRMTVPLTESNIFTVVGRDKLPLLSTYSSASDCVCLNISAHHNLNMISQFLLHVFLKHTETRECNALWQLTSLGKMARRVTVQPMEYSALLKYMLTWSSPSPLLFNSAPTPTSIPLIAL